MIEVCNLTKRYGPNTAVSDLSFVVEDGHIYGFLGPNGAGKSTTMNIMTGCLAASEGTVRIDGHDVFDEPAAAKRLIGYLPELPPLYTDMSPSEYLTFVAKAKGLRGADVAKQVQRVLEATNITDMRDRQIRHLSKGYRQRVGIAQALLADPKVIILDEPTIGLDPKQIIEIRDLIRSLRHKHTVILSSHILSEVSAVCDEIMILSHGRLVACDTPDNLEKMFTGRSQVQLTVSGRAEQVRATLAALAGVQELSVTPGAEDGTVDALIAYAGADIRSSVSAACAAAGLPLLSMSTVKATLEDVFLELTTAEAAEQVAVADTKGGEA